MSDLQRIGVAVGLLAMACQRPDSDKGDAELTSSVVDSGSAFPSDSGDPLLVCAAGEVVVYGAIDTKVVDDREPIFSGGAPFELRLPSGETDGAVKVPLESGGAIDVKLHSNGTANGSFFSDAVSRALGGSVLLTNCDDAQAGSAFRSDSGRVWLKLVALHHSGDPHHQECPLPPVTGELYICIGAAPP